MKKILDACCWITFLIYVFGGLRINGIYYFGYISDILVTVLILLGLASLLKIKLQELSFIRGFEELDLSIRNSIFPRSTKAQFLVIGISYLLILFVLSPLIRHWSYQSSLYDLAMMEQILWRKVSGLGFSSTLLDDGHLLYFPNNHLNFWLFPLSWIYKILPRTETLLILQSLALLSALVPAYKIAKHEFPPWLPAILLPIFYWSFETVHRTNVWDFHETPFMVLPALLAYLYFLKRKWAHVALFTILMALLKEDAWITAGAMGFYFSIKEKKPILGISLFFAGCFIFLGHAVFLNHVNTIGERYAYLGSNFGDALHSIKQNPFILIRQLTKFKSLSLILQVICVGGGLSLLGGLSIIPVLPTLLICALSTHNGMLSLNSHYLMGIAGPLFFAIVTGIKRLDKMMPSKEVTKRVLTFSILLSLSQLVFSESSYVKQTVTSLDWQKRLCFDHLLNSVPKDAPVFTEDPLASHLAERKILHRDDSRFVFNGSSLFVVRPVGQPDGKFNPGRLVASECGYTIVQADKYPL